MPTGDGPLLGGRLTGSRNSHVWLTATGRQNIRVDGQPTTSLHYRFLHLSLMYERKRVTGVPPDPFEGVCQEEALRPAVKEVLYAMVADFGVGLEVTKHLEFRLSGADGTLPDYTGAMRAVGVTPTALIARVKKANRRIASDFHGHTLSGKLENAESEIALAAAIRVVKNQSRPCLIMNDSFIVRSADADFLRQSMTDAYREVVEERYGKLRNPVPLIKPTTPLRSTTVYSREYDDEYDHVRLIPGDLVRITDAGQLGTVTHVAGRQVSVRLGLGTVELDVTDLTLMVRRDSDEDGSGMRE